MAQDPEVPPDRGITGNLGTQELWGCATSVRLRSRLELGLGDLGVERVDNGVI